MESFELVFVDKHELEKLHVNLVNLLSFSAGHESKAKKKEDSNKEFSAKIAAKASQTQKSQPIRF